MSPCQDLGPNHAFTCDCARGMARAMDAQRRFKDAISCLLKVLRACEYLLSESIGEAAFDSAKIGPLAKGCPQIAKRYRDILDTLDALASAYEQHMEDGVSTASLSEPLRRRVISLKEVLYGIAPISLSTPLPCPFIRTQWWKICIIIRSS